MKLEFALNKKNKAPYYLGYAPVPCTIKITDGQPGAAPVQIQMANHNDKGGQLVFYTLPNSQESANLTLQVPGDGSVVSFYIAGKYQAASIKDGDAGIEFKWTDKLLLTVNMMVRVRKNANNLTDGERDRFLNAMVKLVEQGKYQNFLDMHDEAADREIHGRASFLPWHRVFVLDLERHLQEIDPSVTVPYWDFQNKAPKVFSLDFMGIPSQTSSTGRLQFKDGNRLNDWQIGKFPALARRPGFDAQNDKANVEDYSETIGRGKTFDFFSLMEIDPHGSAHTSFSYPAPIMNASIAPRDPLFFMLHANVDRLWAEWQMVDKTNKLFDLNRTEAYNPQSQFHSLANFNIPPIPPKVGDFLNDTMWPWNNINKTNTPGSTRPVTSPGAPLIGSPFSDYPGRQPKVADTIDYQGRLTGHNLYFDYDTVPYINSNQLAGDAPLIAMEKNLHLSTLSSKIETSVLDQEFFLSAFKASPDFTTTIESLSNLNMLTDKDSIEKAIAILTDKKNDAGIRVLALSRLAGAVSSDENLIRYVLELLENPLSPIDLRKASLRTIETIGFSSTVITTLRPQIIQTYRGLMTDSDETIRRGVASYLAAYKDEYAQRLLLSGLEHPEQALVPEDLAINLLGNDMHAGIFPILREIVKKSSNNESRSEAIHLLAADPDSKTLLSDIFNNKKERFNIRKTSLMALKQQSPNDFTSLVQKTIADKEENENIRTLSINSLDTSHFKDENAKQDFIDHIKQIDISILLPAALSLGIKAFLKNVDKEK